MTKENREVLTSIEDIKKEAVSYFQNFLYAQEHNHEEISDQYISSLMSFQCTPEAAIMLIAHVTASEIKAVFLSMPLNKAPGPFGFTVEFYKMAWPIIGCDLAIVVQSFSSTDF